MPSQADIDSKPAARIGRFQLGDLVVTYRRCNDHDDTFEFVGVSHDGSNFSERDESMIIRGICAMLEFEQESESYWLKDRAKRHTEKSEFARE
jgi:hypothetical protein